jgi:hypothetical protein
VLDLNTHDCIRALYLSKFIVDAEILANKLNFMAVVWEARQRSKITAVYAVEKEI